MPSDNQPHPAAPETETLCYIGLGSNLADPLRQIAQARTAIENITGVEEIAFSALYRSKPMGPQDQPDYVNAVMAVRTHLSPLQLLHALQAIETQQGRVRNGERWGPRTLDLDLLLYGELRLNTAELVVPHPGIAARAFVLYPLYEIAPTLTITGLGSLPTLLASCSCNAIERISERIL